MLRIGIITFILDQITKFLVVKYLQLGDTLHLFPGLNIVRVHNYGAAFGMFADHSIMYRIGLIFVAVCICGFLLYGLDKHWNHKYEKLAVSLVISGAAGNICDRIFYGYVVDFIDCYIGTWHWYAYNIADAAICIGCGLLILTSFKSDPSDSQKA